MSQKTRINTRNLNQVAKFLNYLKQKGTVKTQIRNYEWIIGNLDKNIDLQNPQTVEVFVNQLQKSNNYKNRYFYTYQKFCEANNIQWKKPKKFYDNAKEIQIPPRTKIEQIIAYSGKTLGLKLRVSMETGLRPVEIFELKTRDIDLDQRYVYPTTAKHGTPRKIKIPEQLTLLLRDYITRENKQPSDQLFKGDEIRYGKEYRTVRNKLAKKVNDPSIHRIQLYDLRHYFATTTYYKTDLKHTQYLLGHKHSNTTDRYTHLLDNQDEQEYISRTATTVKEAQQLIDAGFTKADEIDGIHIYRKRK
jgi:integrase